MTNMMSFSKINTIHDTHFILPTTKGSMNACMELLGFSTSNKVKNHCFNVFIWIKVDGTASHGSLAMQTNLLSCPLDP